MSENFKIEVIDNTTNYKFNNLKNQLLFLKEFIEDKNIQNSEKLIIHVDMKLNSNKKPIFAIDLSNKEFISLFKDLNITIEETSKGYKCTYVNRDNIKFFSTFNTKAKKEVLFNSDLIKDLQGDNNV